MRYGSGFGVIVLLLLGLGSGIPAPWQAAQTPPPGQVTLIESNAQRVVFEIAAPVLQPQARTVDGVTFTDLSAPNWGMTDAPGKPRVPVYGALIAIPQTAQVTMRLDLDRTKTQILSDPVLPAPRGRIRVDAPDQLPQFQGLDYAPDAETYAQAALYPAAPVTVDEPAMWRSQRYVRVQVMPFQYNPRTGELTTHRRMRVTLDFGLAPNAPEAMTGSAVDEGAFEAILKQGLFNYDSARGWRAPQRVAPNLPRAEAAASATDAFRIAVSADGMYRVTCDALQAAGFDVNNVNLDNVHVTFAGGEIAIDVMEDGDKKCEAGEALVFWGKAPTDTNVPFNVYWLAANDTPGLRMSARSVTGNTTPPTYPKTLHLEENNTYSTYMPWAENVDHWLWKIINHPSISPEVTADLGDLAPGVTDGALRVQLYSGGYANPYAALNSTLYANGVQVSQQNWLSGQILDHNVAVNNLVAGVNTFRIQDIQWGTTPSFVALNYLEVDYPAVFRAVTDTLQFKFGDAGSWQYQIPGFTNADVAAYDITNPANVAKLGVTTAPNGNTFTASFGDDVNALHQYLVLTGAQFKTPLSITLDTPSTLRNPSNGADYILITYGAWKNKLQPLVNQRATMGRVMVVDVQDIYDEFGAGMQTAQAIRDFLAYAYANWQTPKPSYVVLVGSGNFDKGGGEPSYIPVYMKLADPWIGMVASDNAFVTLDQNSPLPSIAIGRLPALSAADVTNMVNKLVGYETSAPGGAWRKNVMFVADNAYEANGALDAAGNFFAYSEEVAGNSYYLPTPMVANRIYYNPCVNIAQYPWCDISAYAAPYPTLNSVRTAILNGMNSGQLIVNYVGHGSISIWTGSILKSADAPLIVPANNKYPFMMPMTCLEGYFQGGNMDGLSEALVKQKDGGAIGSFAPSGLGVSSGHDYLDRGFFEALMQGGKPRAGQATLAAKVKLYVESGGSHFDLLDTYNLLGDPGMLFALPDSIMPPPTNTPTFTPTNTPTNTPTFTPTNTPTNTPTSTSTFTPTNTPVASETPTSTPVISETPTSTPSNDACSVKPAKPELIAPPNQARGLRQRVQLQWTAGACVTKYKVVVRQGSQTGSLADRKVIRDGATSYLTDPLARNQTYAWRVKACNANGCKWSAWRTFQVR